MANGRRNVKVEAAVRAAINRIDDFLDSDTAQLPRLPEPVFRRACENQLARRASVRVGSLFLAFYALEDNSWDFFSVPTGVRGEFGDKLLAEELSKRHLSLHDAIVAYGENLGWKGNVRQVDLHRDPRFNVFCQALQDASPEQRRLIADYLAARFAESRSDIAPLPPVGADILTFARAKDLFFRLLAVKTEGHVQQFLVAALLRVSRSRHGIQVLTHHPHGSDTSDRTAGDIEEFRDGRLLRAWEVTVRPDWKSRMSGFRRKMDHYSLSKYVIVAANVNRDETLRVPAKLITFLEDVERDIAVVDIEDFCVVFAAELTALELRTAVNQAYEFLQHPRLCGRVDFQELYRNVVDRWLDTA